MPSPTPQSQRHRERRESIFLAVMVLTCVLFATGMSVAFMRAADGHGHAARWSQVEDRYDVEVLDKSRWAPTSAGYDPVLVPMKVAGQARLCRVQVVAKDLMVFCGDDAIEAPRR